MPRERRNISEYKSVWLFAMFDLPVDSKAARKRYTRFRNLLLSLGFDMLQYSVYARYFASEDAAVVHRKAVKAILPPEGQVRLLSVTDRQFGKMDVFEGKSSRKPEKPPDQLLLF